MVCQTYSLREVMQLLGIGRDMAYRLVREGKIPSLGLGKRIRVPKPALDAMLSGCSAGTIPINSEHVNG
jgi:excisionase family DNA binding protein